MSGSRQGMRHETPGATRGDKARAARTAVTDRTMLISREGFKRGGCGAADPLSYSAGRLLFLMPARKFAPPEAGFGIRS